MPLAGSVFVGSGRFCKTAPSIKLPLIRSTGGKSNGIEDDAHNDIFDKVPSWKRVVKCLLKNDYWCRTLGFSITKSSNYENYMKITMKINLMQL